MREILLRQFDIARKLLRYHLDGLSTAECLWRPAEVGLHLHAGEDGRWHGDWPQTSSPRMLPRSVTRAFSMPRLSPPHPPEPGAMPTRMPLLLAVLALSALLSSAPAAALQPRVFAPRVISNGGPDIAPAFVAGGGLLFFSRRVDGRWSVLRSARRGQSWSTPVIASFSGKWNDLEAAAAPSGRYLIFASDRPRAGETTRLTARYYGKDQVGGALWRIGLRGAAAGELRRLPESVNTGGSVWTPSIAANDDLAFMRTDVGTGRFRVFLAKSAGRAGYGAVHPLAFSTGAANDVDPAIDPAERFLIFSSDRDTPGVDGAPGPEHLFIALSPLSAHPVVCPVHFPGWSDPKVSEVEPRLSPDGTRLYFASRHPDHAPGAPASGPWDDGNANIWVVHFSPQLWRTGGGRRDCR